MSALVAQFSKSKDSPLARTVVVTFEAGLTLSPMIGGARTSLEVSRFASRTAGDRLVGLASLASTAALVAVT